MFLTAEELADLTDSTRIGKQIKWLLEKKYPFEISTKGRPKVLRSVYIARNGHTQQTERTGPRLRLPA